MSLIFCSSSITISITWSRSHVTAHRVLPVDAAGYGFGSYGLDISGGTIMVGEDNYSIPSGPSTAGRVYFFQYDSSTDLWVLNGNTPIISSEAHFSQNFGTRVAGDAAAGRAVATGDDNQGAGDHNAYDHYPQHSSRPGAAYMFGRDSGVWTERVRILPADARPSQNPTMGCEVVCNAKLNINSAESCNLRGTYLETNIDADLNEENDDR